MLNEAHPMLYELRVEPEATESWMVFNHAVSSQIKDVKDGLYVFFLVNNSDKPIRDGNKGREKTVIHAAGASVKPGKFEGGFDRRLNNYQMHLHWLGDQGEWNRVFTSCFRFAVVLDLSSHNLGFQSTARIFEQFWNQSVFTFLGAQSLLASPPIKQNNRSDWRYIDHQTWSDDIELNFIKFMKSRSDTIIRMITTAAPSD